jgi:hypothetical protein
VEFNLFAKNQLNQSFKIQRIKNYISAGVYSREVTPDPIPNSEVKLSCGDGIAQATVWESSTTPALI